MEASDAPGLADLLERAGRFDDELAALADGEGAVRGEDMDRADTLRRRAELLARRGADPAAVEVVFRDALAVAQGQGSKAYELRAATRFAGWLRSQGRIAEGAGSCRRSTPGSPKASTRQISAKRRR